MARPRRPVQSLQESLAPRLAPQAAPVPFAPTIAPPPDLPIYDFAGISQTIAGYLRKQQDKRDAETQLKGEQFAEQNRLVMADLQGDLAGVKDPAERDRIQKEAFAALRKLGEIPDMADPNVRIGLERANGRIMVGQYWQNLQRRANDVSLAVDPQTGLPKEPLDAERVMAEEWEKISSSPAVQGFYGGREALAQKVDADARFLQQVTQKRTEAEKVHYEQTIAQDWGKAFDAILDSNDAVSTEELKPLSVLVAAEVRDHNMLNPREVLLNALELSFRRRAAIDPDDAVRAVHAAQDIQVGGVRLGDDRSGVGERLQELVRQVRSDAKEKDELELRGEDTKRRLAVQKAQADFMPQLLQAQREGQSLRQVARSLEQKYMQEDQADGRFGGRVAFVIDNLHETVRGLEQEATDDPDVTSSISGLVADGRTDEARALAQSAFQNGTLRGESYGRALSAIDERADVGRFLEDDNLYQATKARYAQAAPRGYDDAIQERMDGETLDLQRRLDRDYAAQVRATQGNPQQRQILRDWLAAREEGDNKLRQEQSAKLRERRDAVAKSVNERNARLQDSKDIIDEAERAGDVTVGEADRMRAQNLQSATAKDELHNIASRDALNLLNDRFQAALGGQMPDQDQLTSFAAAQRKLRDQLGAGIDAMVADTANDPRTFTSRARVIADQVVDEVGGALLSDLVPPSEKVNGAMVARSLSDRLADPFLREDFRASDPIFAPSDEPGLSLHTPGVPVRFYEYAAGWWSQRDPIFGSPVDRDAMDIQVQDLATERFGQADRDQIVAGALDVVGIDAPAVLRGTVQIDVSADMRQQIEDRIESLRFTRDFRPAQADAQIAALQKRLDPVTISLKGHQYKPYLTAFFRSREAFSAFSDDPAYPDFLRAIGIDPSKAEEVQEWVDLQTRAIDRNQ